MNRTNFFIIIFKMNTQKKQKKSFFSKWGKRGKIADGLSTTFFELKLNSTPHVSEQASSNPLQETVKEAYEENRNERMKMDAALHLINVIV
jgi:hypothetical protein